MLTIIKDSKNTYLFNRQLFKKKYTIDSIAIDTPERIVEGSVIIDMDKLCHICIIMQD